MAININKQIGAFFYGNTPMILNSNPNPTNSYAQIVGKTVVHLKAADLAGMTSLPQSFQASNTNLETVEIPNTVVSAGQYTFTGCTSLKYLDFQANSVFTSFGSQFTYGCSSLRELILPNSVSSLGNNADPLSPVQALSKIVFGTGITNCGGFLFSDYHTSLRVIIVLKDCPTASDVPIISSSTIKPSTAYTYVINSQTQTSFSSATNWSSNASRILLLNKIVIDGVEHYIALPRSDTLTQALTKGYLADEHNANLTTLYNFYTDANCTTPFDLTQLVSDYVTSLGEGFTIYTQPKEEE